MDEETKRAIIMEHYMHQLNKIDDVKEGYETVNTANSSCIDNLNIYVDIKNDTIEKNIPYPHVNEGMFFVMHKDQYRTNHQRMEIKAIQVLFFFQLLHHH